MADVIERLLRELAEHVTLPYEGRRLGGIAGTTEARIADARNRDMAERLLLVAVVAAGGDELVERLRWDPHVCSCDHDARTGGCSAMPFADECDFERALRAMLPPPQGDPAHPSWADVLVEAHDVPDTAAALVHEYGPDAVVVHERPVREGAVTLAQMSVAHVTVRDLLDELRRLDVLVFRARQRYRPAPERDGAEEITPGVVRSRSGEVLFGDAHEDAVRAAAESFHRRLIEGAS